MLANSMELAKIMEKYEPIERLANRFAHEEAEMVYNSRVYTKMMVNSVYGFVTHGRYPAMNKRN